MYIAKLVGYHVSQPFAVNGFHANHYKLEAIYNNRLTD